MIRNALLLPVIFGSLLKCYASSADIADTAPRLTAVSLRADQAAWIETADGGCAVVGLQQFDNSGPDRPFWWEYRALGSASTSHGYFGHPPCFEQVVAPGDTVTLVKKNASRSDPLTIYWPLLVKVFSLDWARIDPDTRWLIYDPSMMSIYVLDVSWRKLQP